MEKGKTLSLALTVIAYVGVAFIYPMLRGAVPTSIDDKVFVPALATTVLLLVTFVWQIASYLLLRYTGSGRQVIGEYVSYNAHDREIGLFSISVKRGGAAYQIKGTQYALVDRRIVGSWASSAPVAVESQGGGHRVSYLYVGWNRTSPQPESTRGYSAIQFVGDGLKRGVGLYIDDTRIDQPPSDGAAGNRAMAKINYSNYWKLDRVLVRQVGGPTAASIILDPKILLDHLARLPAHQIEQWLDGAPLRPTGSVQYAASQSR